MYMFRERGPIKGFFSPDSGSGAGLGERTVVGQARLWGDRKLQTTLSRERPSRGSPIRVVDLETLNGPLKWPKLADQDGQVGSLRYHRFTGGIAVPIWREQTVALEKERRFLPDSENLVQLRRGRERPVDLSDLPDRRVVRLRMAISDDIDTAIRQAGHVKERYSVGTEAQQLEVIWREINQAWEKVLGGRERVNEGNLESLAEGMATVLRVHNLARAEKQAKTRIYDQLSGVFKTDSLGRLNPLVQRIRLRSAYLKAIELEAFSVLVSEKFTAIKGILLMEKEITRQSMTDGLKALDTIMGFTKRGAAVFKGKGPRKGELEGLGEALYGIVLLLNRARIAPYLTQARAAGIALWGCRPECVDNNRVVIGNEAAATLLDESFKGVRRLLTEEKFDDAKVLTKIWVFDPLWNLLGETAKTSES